MRLEHLQAWHQGTQADVIALQETKTQDSEFPHDALRALNLHAVFSGQRTYNGVAILSKVPAENVVHGIPGFTDEQKRVLAATVHDVRIINVYVPNGQALDSEKFQYKLDWLQALNAYLHSELQQHRKLVLLGDFNIAPADQDVHDPKAWEGSVHVSPQERSALQSLLQLGTTDLFRNFEQPEKSFSWWDYRAAGFRRNAGLRIDLILGSQEMSDRCSSCVIDKEPRKLDRPSDHTPVIAEFSI